MSAVIKTDSLTLAASHPSLEITKVLDSNGVFVRVEIKQIWTDRAHDIWIPLADIPNLIATLRSMMVESES